MYWKTKVSPPDQDLYLSRCRALRRHLVNAHKIPTIIIVSACWDVMKEAFGSDLRALRWLILTVAHSRGRHLKRTAWYNWHMYVRLRTQEEINELIFQSTEEATGVDVKEQYNEAADAQERNAGNG